MNINNIEFDDFIFTNRKRNKLMCSYNEYIKEQKELSNKGKINYKFMRVAKKNYTCEKCGCEIHKNEEYYEWKPLPTKKHWFSWRKRCINCEPMSYAEVHYYEDTHCRVSQINIRKDCKLSYL